MLSSDKLARLACSAVPVVSWFNVGNVQLFKAPDAGVPNAGATSVLLVSV